MPKLNINKSILFEEDIRRLDSICAYIKKNLDKDLSLADLCDQFKIGNSTLRRQFTFNYQQTVSAFIQECRMVKAMELILNRETSIKKIAEQTGYRRLSSFTHVFRKHFGQPPKYYLEVSKLLRRAN